LVKTRQYEKLLTQNVSGTKFRTNKKILSSVDRASQYTYVIKTNLIYYLSFSVDCLLAGQQTVNWKAQHVPIVCIYTVYLLMMGYKYAQNM